MKTIINATTGKIHYCTVVDYELQENEIAIDELLTMPYIKPYFNFETREFYEVATQQEIDEYNINNQQ